MDRVIDYSRLCHFIKNDIPKMGHIYLLESLADAIISYCFTDSRVEKVLVRIDKTGAFSEATSAGIQIIRTRKRLKP